MACAALLAAQACDLQVDSDYEGDSLLRVHGRISVPLELEGRGLRPVIAFSTRETLRDSRNELHVTKVAVSGEFPSGFTIDLLEPPPPGAQTVIGGEPDHALGRLMVVGADYPSVVTRLHADFRPIPSCSEPDNCHRETICAGESWPQELAFIAMDADLPSDRGCLSQITRCSLKPNDVAYECAEAEEYGDAALHTFGYSEGLQFVYFFQPVPADTVLARQYNAGKPISAGYHVYVEPAYPNDDIEWDPNAPPEPSSCWQLAEAEALRRYNEEHGTSFFLAPDFALEQEDPTLFEYFEYQRSIIRVAREMECPFESLIPELGPGELIEIQLKPGTPAPQ
jgi:hypothetical protein